MFEQYTIIKTTAQAEAWLRAVVQAEGKYDSVCYPEDCEKIVEHFARVGVAITADEANSFWSAYSSSMQSVWIVLTRDCVAALDALVEEIENGECEEKPLQALKGTVKAEA